MLVETELTDNDDKRSGDSPQPRLETPPKIKDEKNCDFEISLDRPEILVQHKPYFSHISERR